MAEIQKKSGKFWKIRKPERFRKNLENPESFRKIRNVWHLWE
jgi:hypothetical protein